MKQNLSVRFVIFSAFSRISLRSTAWPYSSNISAPRGQRLGVMSNPVVRCGRAELDDVLAQMSENEDITVLAGPSAVMSRMAHEISAWTPGSVLVSTSTDAQLLAEEMELAGTDPDSVVTATKSRSQLAECLPELAALVLEDTTRPCIILDRCVQPLDSKSVLRLSKLVRVVVTVHEGEEECWPVDTWIHVDYTRAENLQIVFHLDRIGVGCRWKQPPSEPGFSQRFKAPQPQPRVSSAGFAQNAAVQQSGTINQPRLPLHPTVKKKEKTQESNTGEVLSSLLATMQVDRIALPEFSGQASAYLSFRRVLTEQIMKYESNAAVLFSKLLTACKGSALRTIEGCSLLPAEQALTQAISLLDARYGDPDIVVDEVCNTLVRGPSFVLGIDNSLLVDYTCTIRASLVTLQDMSEVYQMDYVRVAETPRVMGTIIARLPESWRNSFLGRVHGRPTLAALSRFVTDRAGVLNSVVYKYVAQRTRAQKLKKAKDAGSYGKPLGESPQDSSRNVFSTTGVNANVACGLCGQAHTVESCGQFKEKSPRQRARVLRRMKACFACLKSGHTNAECQALAAKRNCTFDGCVWVGAHHPTLCRTKDSSAFNVTEEDSSQSEDSDSEPIGEGEVVCQNVVGEEQPGVFMNVMAVVLKNSETGRSMTTYALLDPCANVDVISEDMVTKLGLSVRHKQGGKIGTVAGAVSGQDRRTAVHVAGIPEWATSRLLDNVAVLPCKHFKGIRCPVKLDVEKYPEIGVALPSNTVNHPYVSVLISMRNWDLHVPQAVRSVQVNGPKLIQTALGYVVMGPCYGKVQCRSDGRTPVSNFVLQSSSADDSPQAWVDEMCSIPDYQDLYSPEKVPSREEREAWRKMEDSMTVEDSQYVVRQPWRDLDPKFPDNLSQAFGHLESARRGFRKNPERFARYAAVMAKHVALDHAEKVPESEVQSQLGRRFYLLHHAVQHPRKDEPRVVFNASKLCHGQSLNNSISKSPDLLNSLVGVLIRFRERPVAISADIKGFYLAVRIPRQDWDFARFLWFEGNDLDGKPAHFRLKVHLFGGVASQAAAIIALKRTIADAELSGFITKEQALAYERSFYSDDHLASYDDPDIALEESRILVDVLATRKFELTKFQSSHAAIVQSLRSNAGNMVEVDLTNGTETSALGIAWNAVMDYFVYRCGVDQVPQSPRTALSVLMRTYDLLGLVAPFLVPLKLLVRDVAHDGRAWDDTLSPDELKRAERCMDTLRNLDGLHIPRCYVGVGVDPRAVVCRELHMFSDGSENCYGACGYVRIVDSGGQISTALIASKNKLVPRKKVLTIPKIELSAAALGVRLARSLRQEISVSLTAVYFWTDSRAVLAMIRNVTTRFPRFEANRLAEIEAGSRQDEWNYVNTKDNPADILSRGHFLKNRNSKSKEDGAVVRWFQGAEFLRTSREWWPNSDSDTCHAVEDTTTGVVNVVVSSDWSFVKWNSWFRLSYHVAWWLRFRNLLRNKVRVKKGLPVDPDTHIGPVAVAELRSAQKWIIVNVQAEAFPEEIRCVERGQPMPGDSPLRALRPVLLDGLLCVGGRLKNAVLALGRKHPAILPARGHVTQLILDHAHRMSGHASANQVLNELRLKYWIVGAGRSVKAFVDKCLECKRYKAKVGEQIMADLPADRVAHLDPVFSHVGVDCFGPFVVRRARSDVKRWIVIFTCLTSRACHFEVIFTMEMDSFMQAYRRFAARRGTPTTIRSDNGSNLAAADRELRKTMNTWNQEMGHEFLQLGVQWTYNPPYGQHFGGAWERLIAMAKSALRHTLLGQTVTDETLLTLVCEAEAVINSRPLTPCSNDPKDMKALTPYDILLLRPVVPLPNGLFVKEDTYVTKSYKAAQHLANVFWARFRKEYLPSLQIRSKWRRERKDIQVNDLVLLVDEKAPRGVWLMGRVSKVKLSDDGHVRSLTVITARREYERPVTKVAILERAAVDIDN